MLTYHGNDRRLAEAVDKNRIFFEDVYREILGPALYEKLEQAEKRLVTPGSYDQDPPGRPIELSKKRIPKFGLVTYYDLDSQKIVRLLDTDGTVVGSLRIMAAPYFPFQNDSESLQDRQFPRYMKSFNNQWTKFTLYALQNHPAQVMAAVPLRVLMNMGYEGSIPEIYQQASCAGLELADVSVSLISIAEALSIKLEDMVWKGLGLEHPTSTGNLEMLKRSGLDQLDAPSFLEKALNWEEAFRHRPVARYLETFRGRINVEKMSREDLEKRTAHTDKQKQ
jgi:hypothetical protein